MNPQGDFWAITSYFNPIGYRKRLENYHIFRKRLVVPLLTVELSHTGDYQLAPGDAEILIQLQCPDLLWHKERLLNIGLASLPPQCDTVAWLDCDVVLESDDWPQRTRRLLETHPLVVPFRTAYYPPKDKLPWDEHARHEVRHSLIHALASNIASPEVLRAGLRAHGIAIGLAGAARRPLLERHGFYDACAMGGGDRALIAAALGRFDDFVAYLQMGPAWTRHYLAWALPFFESVRGRVASLDGGIFHLWHGELANRGYPARNGLLRDASFDPETDLVRDRNGCWRWNPARSSLQEQIRRGFESRREDG